MHAGAAAGAVRRWRPTHWAGLILALYFAAGITYSVVTPVFEAPDEIYHVPYVLHLVETGRLPIQDAAHPGLWEQEGSQPPLYYALAALWSGWIRADDLEAVRALNPHARVGVALAQDNRNMVVHPAPERFPWHGTVLAVHWMRLLSLLLGGGTVWCTYALGRRIAPARPEMALGAMALNASIPQFLFISASVNNDNLITLLASLALWQMVRLMQVGASWRRGLWLGATIGLACLAKLSGLALLALAALVLALEAWRAASGSSRWRRALCHMALVLAPVVLIAGWWYLRNLRLYGDLTGLGAMLDIFGRRARPPTLVELLGEFQGLRISFWGLFGMVNILMRPRWVYPVLDLATLAAAAGLVRGALQRCSAHSTPEHSMPWHGTPWRGTPWREITLLAAWTVAVCAALVRWTMMTKATQGRLLFPAIGAICLLGMAGWLEWAPRRARAASAGLTVGLLACLAISAPFSSIDPAYAHPPTATLQDVPASAQPFNTTYGDVIRLVAFEVEPRAVEPGRPLHVTLYWQALAPMQENYSVYLHLFGWQGQPIGQRDSHAGMGAYPTRSWQVGEVVRDTYELPVSRLAQGPVAAELEVGLYRLADMERLPVVDGQGQSVGRPIIARIKVAVPTLRLEPAVRVGVAFAEQVTLAGYDLSAQRARPGGSLDLGLCWEAQGPLSKDYSIFVHLVAADGTILAQGDGPPLGGAYPTSLWAAGEALRDVHRIAIPSDAAAQQTRLIVGLYDLATSVRVPLQDAALGDALPLADVTIAP